MTKAELAQIQMFEDGFAAGEWRIAKWWTSDDD
jgi:hypothetical protein